MNRRYSIRIPLATVGVASAAACFSAALALAQSEAGSFQIGEYQIAPDPDSTAEVTGFYGMQAAAPAVGGSVQGTQVFDVYNTAGNVIGSFEAFTSNNLDAPVSNGINEEIFVTRVLTGTAGTAPGDVPPTGSVFDAWTGGSTLANSYAAIPSSTPGGTDTVSDTLTTPFGQFSLPLTYDAAAHVDSHVMAPLPLGDGYSIVADPDSAETLTHISAIPPDYVAGQGEQLFDVVDPDGNTVAKFTALTTTTGDLLTGHSAALIVTSDMSGTVGTADGDAPPVGSVFNVLYYFNPDLFTMYSDLAATTSGGSGTISTTLHAFGTSFDIPTTFDAVKGLTDGTQLLDSIPYADGLTIVEHPGATGTFFGINGQPPITADIQGYNTFDILSADNQVQGTFKADETVYTDFQGHLDEALVVTEAGGAAAPPVGSWIEYQDDGNGFATLYTDLVSPTGNTMSQTWITPFGTSMSRPRSTRLWDCSGSTSSFRHPESHAQHGRDRYPVTKTAVGWSTRYAAARM